VSNAPRDNNQIPTILGTSNADGKTPVPIYVDAADHSMCVEDAATGSDLSDDDADRDDNGIPVMMAVSSADGKTPCAVYVNAANNKLLIQST